MKIDATHDFPPVSAMIWNCRGCGCLPRSLDAGLPCKPPRFTDDPRAAADTLPCDVEPGEVWR